MAARRMTAGICLATVGNALMSAGLVRTPIEWGLAAPGMALVVLGLAAVLFWRDPQPPMGGPRGSW
jgi:hypothetical protein